MLSKHVRNNLLMLPNALWCHCPCWPWSACFFCMSKRHFLRFSMASKMGPLQKYWYWTGPEWEQSLKITALSIFLEKSFLRFSMPQINKSTKFDPLAIKHPYTFFRFWLHISTFARQRSQCLHGHRMLVCIHPFKKSLN